MIKFEKNILKISDSIIREFDFNIRNIIATDDKIIVLLEIPYDNSVEKNNVLAVNFIGNILWIVDNSKYSKNILPFEQMTLDGDSLFASDFYARRVEIDIDNGKIKDVFITK